MNIQVFRDFERSFLLFYHFCYMRMRIEIIQGEGDKEKEREEEIQLYQEITRT